MTDDDKKHFWTSLPGILTGAASLLTAVVTLFAFLGSQQGSKPNLKNAAKVCGQIVGDWDWFLGEAHIDSDGHVYWKKDEVTKVNDLTGSWSCLDGNARRFMIQWPNGFTDTITLSSDANSLTGSNQVGVQISAIRRK